MASISGYASYSTMEGTRIELAPPAPPITVVTARWLTAVIANTVNIY